MSDSSEFQKQLINLLPNRAMWRFRETWVSFYFSRLKGHLSPVTAEPIAGGPPLPADWFRYQVFGEEKFPNAGGAFVCLDEIDGSVVRIDVELEQPLSRFNTSGERFATSFNLLNEFFASATPDLENLTRRLRLADSEAFDAGSLAITGRLFEMRNAKGHIPWMAVRISRSA